MIEHKKVSEYVWAKKQVWQHKTGKSEIRTEETQRE